MKLLSRWATKGGGPREVRHSAGCARARYNPGRRLVLISNAVTVSRSRARDLRINFPFDPKPEFVSLEL